MCICYKVYIYETYSIIKSMYNESICYMKLGLYICKPLHFHKILQFCNSKGSVTGKFEEYMSCSHSCIDYTWP